MARTSLPRTHARARAPERTGVEDVRMLTQLVMAQNASTSSIRAHLAKALGYEFQGDRDIYTALGYKKNLGFADYQARFERQDIAKTIVRAPADECWKDSPLVKEKFSEGEETEFEKKWKALVQDEALNLYHYLHRLDVVSGIGRYGCLYIGYDDVGRNKKVDKPATKAKEILFLAPLSEQNAKITRWVKDISNPRYGKPEIYELILAAGTEDSTTHKVHWSRVVHTAEGALENNTFGTPRLQAVFNRLQDMEKVVGGAGEGYWQQGFPGLHFDIRDEFSPEPEDLESLKSQIEDYMHRFTRVLRTQGIDVKTLLAQMSDPSKIEGVLIDLIAGTTGIPKRILIGSERGDLASTQDEAAWAKRMTTRRERFVNPMILNPFIHNLGNAGILTVPPKGWQYEWPDLHAPSDQEKAEVNRIKTEALVKYSDSLNADMVIPPDEYLDLFMDLTADQIEQIKKAQEEMVKIKEKEMEEEQVQIDQEREEEEGRRAGDIADVDRRREEDKAFEREGRRVAS